MYKKNGINIKIVEQSYYIIQNNLCVYILPNIPSLSLAHTLLYKKNGTKNKIIAEYFHHMILYCRIF